MADDDDDATDGLSSAEKRYILLHKPRGVLSARRRDPSNLSLPTVTELLASGGLAHAEGVWPVGRLDAESEGLLLLTNDGRITTLMTRPDRGCQKTYLAVTRGYGRPGARKRLGAALCVGAVRDGIVLRPTSATPYLARPVMMAQLSFAAADAALGGALPRCLDGLLTSVDASSPAATGAGAGAGAGGANGASAGTGAGAGGLNGAAAEAAELDFVRVTMTEGKKHEVRLLLRAGGFATLRLVRIAHGPLSDAALLARRPGAWRALAPHERAALQRGAAAPERDGESCRTEPSSEGVP